MSRENVETVRRGWQAFNRGDIETLLALCDPAVVWDQRRYVAGEFDPVYYGHDGINHFLREWREFFDDYHVDLEELIDAGEAVLARARQVGRGRQSGATVESPPYWVLTRLRNRMAMRIELYRDETEARKAVGLEE